MDFGYVLTRAWKIIWKFKVLWIFGILASCGQASGTGSNSGYRFSSQDTNLFPQIQQYFNQLSPGGIAATIAIGILVILVLVVLAVLLGTVGRIGLIRGTVKAEQGTEHMTFGELWRDGLTYFWRVFGLNLLIGLIIGLVIMVLFTPVAVLAVLTNGVLGLCFIPLVCLFIPVMWAVSVVIEQANIALVVENLGIRAAIQRGWQVVINNIGNMIVMSLILTLGVGLIGGAIIGLPLLAVLAPAIGAGISGSNTALRSGLLISGILFLVYLPFLLAFSGILRSYISSAWTLTYMRLTAKPVGFAMETPILPGQPDLPPAAPPMETPILPSQPDLPSAAPPEEPTGMGTPPLQSP